MLCKLDLLFEKGCTERRAGGSQVAGHEVREAGRTCTLEVRVNGLYVCMFVCTE